MFLERKGLKGHRMSLSCVRPSDIIKALIFLDNFCPCLTIYSDEYEFKSNFWNILSKSIRYKNIKILMWNSNFKISDLALV